MRSLNSQKYSIVEVLKNDNGKRLDSVLIKFLKFPKSRIMKHIRNGDILLNKSKVPFSHRVFQGDEIYLYKPLMQKLSADLGVAKIEESAVTKEVRERIIYEDEDLLVINKRRGVLVHGDNSLDTLVNFYLLNENLKSISFKPSAVHRIDRNTSGIIIFAKNVSSARILSSAFSSGTVIKKYVALLEGEVKMAVVYRNFLYRDKVARKTLVLEKADKVNAVTHVKPILISKFFTLAEISIETGFTHQIRAQCAFNNHALVGDKKYHSKYRKANYFLHSFLIEFSESLFLKDEFFVEPSSDFLQQIVDVFGVYGFKEFI
ncbi:RluA family pseudouridine synthase [Borrelia sp. BU AG58]|uniref:RluA family pseudouridine synthase n=1 Tax=Borrelia sp. BU AG58 TaxID=2887345 RepID=UPI001E4DF9AF|nr:RluA family pseudouridine synthase [Borrelia sp. BU AG58]UER67956.1 RluA family pseudouridine synthase [Borrelia sp. BU AG58]